MKETESTDIWKFVAGNEAAIANHLQVLAEILPPATCQRAKGVARRLERSLRRGDGMSRAETQRKALADRDLLAIVSPLLERAGDSASGEPMTESELLSDLQIGVCRLSRCGTAEGGIMGLFVYPGLLMVGLIGIVMFFNRMVLPLVKTIIDEFGIPLPRSMEIMLNVSNFIETAWPLLVCAALLAAAPMIVEMFRRTGLALGLVQWIDDLLAGKRLAVATWVRHAALLLQTGITDDLSGETLALPDKSWMRSGDLPWRFGLIEETLKLDDLPAKIALLNQTSDYFSARHRSAVQWWASFLPTILMMLIGGLFAFVIASTLMPIIAMISGLTGGTF